MLPLAPAKLYVCPGDTHPISRAVHLSRLAAYFPGCRECPFRTETGQLPTRVVERVQHTTKQRVERKTLFTTEGVRGVHRNELSRAKVGAMAGAVRHACPIMQSPIWFEGCWSGTPGAAPSEQQSCPEAEACCAAPASMGQSLQAQAFATPPEASAAATRRQSQNWRIQ